LPERIATGLVMQDTYIGGRSENNIKCMTNTGIRTEQLDIIEGLRERTAYVPQL